MLGVTIVLILILEVVSTVILRRLEARSGERRQELYWAESDSYAQESWIDQYTVDYFRIRLRWEPYVYWQRQPFSSRYINVEASGIRKTSPGLVPENGPPAARIFVFGGSTTWGEGARDEATVPSAIAQSLARDGIRAEVLNYGEGGYVSTQELLVLLRELHRGNVPDIAVFYHGLNDRYAAAQSGEAGIPQNEWNRRTEFGLSGRRIQLYLLALTGPRTGLSTARLLSRVMHGGQGCSAPALSDTLAQEVVDAYVANVRAIMGLARDYRFTPRFYWQPVLYEKPSLTPFETILKQTQPAHFEPFFAAVQTSINAAKPHLQPPHFQDIRDIFFDHADPVYIDFSHLSEVGNRRIGERIADDVKTLLEPAKIAYR